MPAPRQISAIAERELAASVVTQNEIRKLRARQERLLLRRRHQWLRAVDNFGSAVSRERIASGCSVTIACVDKELARARQERDA